MTPLPLSALRKVLISSASLTTLVIVCFVFYLSHPSGDKIVFHGGFKLHFLMAIDNDHFFMCLLAFIYLLWRHLYSDFVGPTFPFGYMSLFLHCTSYVDILDAIFLSDIRFANMWPL